MSSCTFLHQLWCPLTSVRRGHPVKRKRDGTDGGDAERGRGQPEEHLLPRGAEGAGDVPSGGGPPGVHAAALPHGLAHGQHQEPAAQRRLLPAVGVVAAAPQASSPPPACIIAPPAPVCAASASCWLSNSSHEFNIHHFYMSWSFKSYWKVPRVSNA